MTESSPNAAILDALIEIELRLDRIYEQLDILTKMVTTTHEEVIRNSHNIMTLAEQQY